MEQRAAMLGGEVVTGPTGRGFLVSARLPIPDPGGGSGAPPPRPPRLGRPRRPAEEVTT
jgi:hypothetical protein